MVRQISVAGSGTFDVALSGFEQAAGLYLIQVSDGHTNQALKMIKL